jgi:hypothetical protein
MADTVDFILADTAIAVGRGVGSKEVVPAAVKFWRATYRKSITEAIKNGAVYKDDRRAVLLMSVKLGRTARRLAKKGKVTKAVAKKATKIISNDPTCGAGGGRYCAV